MVRKKSIYSDSNFGNFSNSYRYILEKGSKKHHCPRCNEKTFVLYIDTETGDYLPIQYGRCDREIKCSYHLNPYTDGYAKEQKPGQFNQYRTPYRPIPRKKNLIKPRISFIPVEVFKQTLHGYEQNTFIQNLLYRVHFTFEATDIEKVISLYYLGSICNGYRSGAITFPFIDIQGNVRAIQVKQFDQDNHTTGTDFLHSIIKKHHTRNNKPLPEWLEAYNKNETKVSCLFGEHLLSKYPYNPVALVEAPKTAIYGALYFGYPDQPMNLLWLAVYNLSSLNLNKCKALKGRNVYLFPDLSKGGKAFELWSNKAAEIQKRLQGTYFYVSDLLERSAPQRDKSEGNDLADYLIKQDWRLFRERNIQEQPPQPEPEVIETSTIQKPFAATYATIPEPKTVGTSTKGVTEVTKVTVQINTFFSQPKSREDWSNDIAELESFFARIELPTHPVKLNGCSTITDCSLFIESHFATVKANNGKRTFLPYLHRLQELKQYCWTESVSVTLR